MTTFERRTNASLLITDAFHMISTNVLRLAANLGFTAVLCGLASCKPVVAPHGTQNQTPAAASSSETNGGVRRQQPSPAELANFVRSHLPPVLKLVDLKNDPPVPLPGSALGRNAWLYNVRLTFAATEDELGAPPPQAAQVFQALVDELNELVAWSQAYAKSPYASLYPGFTVEPPEPAAPHLLILLHPKDAPHAPIYGQLAAEWQVDHWQFAMQDAALPEEEGRFRSAFTGPILIQGEPATDRFVAAAKAAVAQAKPKQEAIERRYQKDLQSATQPGTLYRGQITKGKNSMPAEVRFLAPAPGNDPGVTPCELRLPASDYVYTCSIKLARRVPNMPTAAAGSDKPFTQLVEPSAQGDVTLSFEHHNTPKFKPADVLANDLLYSQMGVRDMPLNLRGGLLQGNVVTMPVSASFVLSAQQVP